MSLVFMWAAALYWLVLFPTAVRERRRWQRRASAMPDCTLRAHALTKLEDEHLLAEGAAAFAILAHRRQRRRVARISVTYELLIDYLDALTEAHPTLENNRSLHRALTTAVDLDAAVCDYYQHHPQRDDGGYLDALVATCRIELSRLSRRETVAAAMRRAAAGAAEAQSLTHADGAEGHDALASWARSQHGVAEEALRWWEIAAAAGSPLGVLALVAAASDPRTTAADAAAIEAAYFPWIAALFGLLESLIDQDDDVATGNHSYVSHYRSSHEAVERLRAISQRAVEDAARLPRASRHRLLLAGMVGMVLTQADATNDFTRAGTDAVHAAMGSIVTPFIAMLRLRELAPRARP